MFDKGLQTRDEVAAKYLQQLQALGSEISIAMEAIAANALIRFEESVAKQEMLCADLVTMANTVSEGVLLAEPPSFSRIETAVDVKIRAASGAVRDLNLRYAALLKHSGKSIALLASLCRSQTGEFQEAREPRLKRQTWSCEM